MRFRDLIVQMKTAQGLRRARLLNYTVASVWLHQGKFIRICTNRFVSISEDIVEGNARKRSFGLGWRWTRSLIERRPELMVLRFLFAWRSLEGITIRFSET